jgi:enoyl-CoA hydratase/carnithine racemase
MTYLWRCRVGDPTAPVFDFMRALVACSKPVVAAVTGAAIGIGTTLLLLGEPFSAEEAVDMRIANAVLPAGEVARHARRVAERFNALPPSAVRDAKRLMRRVSQQSVLDAIGIEAGVFRQRLSSAEAGEAFSAVFQKRKPDFSAFS